MQKKEKIKMLKKQLNSHRIFIIMKIIKIIIMKLKKLKIKFFYEFYNFIGNIF